jgi:hypothetical protein
MGAGNLLANENDGFLRSHAADYTVARAGTSTVDVVNGGDVLHFGQWFDVGQYWPTETFQEFTFTPVSTNEFCTSASYHFLGFNKGAHSVPWSCEIRDKDWGGTLEASDWVPGADLGSQPLLAEFPTFGTEFYLRYEHRSGSAAFRTRMSSTTPLRVVVSSSKTRQGLPPEAGVPDQYQSVDAFEGATGAHRPRVKFASATKSTLSYVAGASVQLSDGSHVYLESTVGTPVITLKHSTLSGTITTIATIAQGAELFQFALGPGQQSFALERDSSDNLFVLGAAGAFTSGITAQAFVKGSGYNWSARTAISAQLPAYDQPVNNCVLTWHNVNGTSRLAAAVAHTQGNIVGTSQMVAVSLSTENILAGGGSPIIATAPISSSPDGLSVNTTGNGLDIQAINAGTGVIGTVRHNDIRSDLSVIDALFKYTLTNTGAFAVTPTDVGGFSGRTFDGDLSVQIMPIPGDVNRFYWRSGTVVTSWTLTTAGATKNGTVGLIGAAIPTLSNPNPAQPLTSFYDPSTNKVWVFYVDGSNPRRVLRTAVNCATMLPTMEEIEVATNLGASGSVTTLLRTPRGFVDERVVQLHIGNRTSGGTHSTIVNNYTAFNLFPNPPVLNNPGSFTAESVKIFTWLFSDANPKDRQSAFQLQIRTADTLAVVVDTSKVTSTLNAYSVSASTLSNSQAYEWRVRTYDTEDNVSLYSAYQAFSTVTTGIVLITSPESDSTPSSSPRLTITWVYTITAPLTQAKYRVRVIRTDTNEVIFNSGFITSTDARSYEVQGLLTDVQQSIELIIQDSSGALSNTFTRLVTPSFSSPNAPGFLAAPGDGGIIVTVVNSIPTGALPPATRNDIYRSLSGENRFIKVGETPPNSQFVDYTVASGTLYDYKVAAVASGETFSNDTMEGISVDLFGVYIHIPNDSSSVRRFLYGSVNNSDQIASSAAEMKFVGRTYPVYEFGSALSEIVDVEIMIPSEADRSDLSLIEYVRTAVRNRSIYCYRDSRGRKIFGVITNSSSKNTSGGMTVSLSVKRADYSEELP